jgi:pullulanase/glycogen debranching enzyme
VPMITAGDERGRTQRGNNNAYCHDAPLTWVDWETDPTWAHLTELVTDCLSLRREHPVLRQRHFFAGQPVGDGSRKDLTWLHPRGDEMRQADWFDERLHTLGMLLNGEPADDDSLLLWLHAGDRSTALIAPSGPWSLDWDVVVDTSQRVRGQRTSPGTRLTVPGRTLLLLRGRR